MLKSHFKGTGLKFKEHQIYSHGDDVRFIDWKMLAKTNLPYIKTFEEDRNIEITVLLDCSRGMMMGYDGKTKIEAAIEITSLLYLLSGTTNDYVQTILCMGNRNVRVPKKRGEAGIIALVDTLKSNGLLDGEGNINHAFTAKSDNKSEAEKSLIKEFYRKREVVVLSDFYDFLSTQALKSLVIRKHVHAFRMLTPLDHADDFKYSIKATSFSGKNKGVLDMKLDTKKDKHIPSELRLKDLFLEKRYLEDFVKEML